MSGGRRVSIGVIMSQVPHPTTGKVQACNDCDHYEGHGRKCLDPTGHRLSRPTRRSRAGPSFGDRIQVQFHCPHCETGRDVR